MLELCLSKYRINWSSLSFMRKRFSWVIALIAATILGLSGAGWAQDKPVVTVQADPSQIAVAPGGKATLSLRLTIDPKYHINSNPTSEDYLIPVEAKVTPTSGITVGKPIYPAGVKKKFAFTTAPISVYEGETVIQVPLSVAPTAKPGTTSLAGAVSYQACDDNNCLIPTEAKFKVSLTVGGSPVASSTNESTPVENAATENSATENSAPEAASTDAAFAQAEKLRAQYKVGGLPAIIFIDAQGQERTDLRAGEELTLDGMKSKMTALATGGQTNADTAGGAQSWAVRLQNSALWVQLLLAFGGGLLLNLTPCVYPMIPITVGYFGAQSEGRMSKTFGLALLYVLGLALVYSGLGVTAALTGQLFGSALQSPWVTGAVAAVLFVLGLGMLGLFTIQPPSFILSKSGAKKGAAGALAMGALLGIVAAPCVGPVVAALLTYVGTKGSPALGFALFFALSLGLGLPYLLLGTFSGSIKSLPRSGAWLEKSKKIFAVPMLIAAAFYAWTAGNALAVPTASTGEHWPLATAEQLSAARSSGRPVILDFRADWCIPCRKMEEEIFSRPEILAAAKEQKIELLQVDLTRASA
jgi:thiol:disulfide interchange protein